MRIELVPDVKAELTNHIVEKGIDGIFYYTAKEEALFDRILQNGQRIHQTTKEKDYGKIFF